MFKHYLKLVINLFTRHRLYSVLNVMGLGISLAVALIIGLFVQHQLSYERHFKHAERIYQIGQQSMSDRFGNPHASSPLVAERFPALFPSIEDITQVSFPQHALLDSRGQGEREGVQNMECCISHVDERFFRIFNVDWLYGDAHSALSDPHSVVLTRPLARKYFGSAEAAYGSVLLYERERTVRVTGVIEELPDNSVLQFPAFFSIDLYFDTYNSQPGMLESWGGTIVRTFARFDRKAPSDQLLTDMQPAIDAELGEASEKISFNIRPITRLYLDHNLGRVQLFAAIGLAILLIAVINFVNLATARASTRALEVGLKRSLGAGRFQLIRQFLFESFTMVILAMVIALAAAELLLPLANNVLDVQLSYTIFTDACAIAVLILATIGLGVLAGLYPAFYLTSLNPVQGLKNEGLTGKGSHYFRNTLVLLQFSVSIALIAATLIFLLQIRYTESFDRGFEHEDVVVVPFPSEDSVNTRLRWPGLQEALLAHPAIRDANLSHLSPMPNGIVVIPVRQEGSPDRHQFSVLSGEADFLQFYGIELVAGDYFPADATSNFQEDENEEPPLPNFSSGVILNEAAVRALEWQPQEAIGRSLYLDREDEVTGRVVGVVRDVVENLERSPEPYVYAVRDNFPPSRFLPPRMNIRLNSSAHEAAMAHIEQTWDNYYPDRLMQPTFLAESINAQTRSQEYQLRIFTYASIFAVVVTCFGLFGLATFNAERRTQEIGVRKVMGGSVWSIVLLLTNDFSKLVLIANVIAWPVAYIGVNRWLENFAYRIGLTPLVFIASGLIALCVAWATVGLIAAKAASAKPVLALRYE